MTDSSVDFDRDELIRYSRHLSLPGFGLEGQRRLKAGSVAIVGAGGLGSPAALYLAAAGLGTVGIVDFDRVDVSNLHRQLLYGVSDIGACKIDAAAKRLADVNPHVSVVKHDARLDSGNALEILGQYDVVLDGTDNFRTRYLVNDACVLLGKPNVYASVLRFEGQLSVFSIGDAPCYRCLYPEPPPDGSVPSCAEAGVLGVLPGLLGVLQATEAIKLIAGVGSPTQGRLLLVDALTSQFRSIRIRRDPQCPACGTRELRSLRDVDDHCVITRRGTLATSSGEGAPRPLPNPAPAPARARVQAMEPAELAVRLDSGGRLELLDVREPWEWAIARLEGARLLPLGDLASVIDTLDRSLDVVIYCHHGARSYTAAAFLLARGFTRVWNLVGGIDRYSAVVDPRIPRY